MLDWVRSRAVNWHRFIPKGLYIIGRGLSGRGNNFQIWGRNVSHLIRARFRLRNLRTGRVTNTHALLIR
jgi:hypothetical protein